MLSRLDQLLELHVPLADIEREAAEFDSQVTQAVERDPEVAAYVRQLEDSDAADPEPQAEHADHSELPAGETVVRELEEFLRRSQGDLPSN